MTRRFKIYVIVSVFFVITIFLGLLILRFCSGGVIVTPSKQNDPTGIGLAYQRKWKVWNLWFTPVEIDIVKKTCSCISADIESSSIPFGNSRTVSLIVSAIGKKHYFNEKAILEMTRGRSKVTKILNVQGQKFSGFFVWPDAIRIPQSTKNVYSELMKVKFSNGIPFEDVTVQTIGQSNIQTEWLSHPNIVGDGIYAEATLKITINSKSEFADYLVFSVKGTAVKIVKIFST